MNMMEKFQEGIERVLVPLASKLNSQRHICAVRDAFILSFPLTMAGSLMTLLNFVLLSPDGFIAKLLRLEYENQLKSQRRLLKKKRINAYHIKNDELTNEPLKVRTAEFSHIRSVAMYKFISDSIDNGLIVNKETHKIITAEGVNDENELLSLCHSRNWSVDWYDIFVEKLSHLTG